jgi:hypothetical protein
MQAVLGIRIRMFLGFLDPDPYPLVRGTGPDLVVMCVATKNPNKKSSANMDPDQKKIIPDP